MTSLYRTLKSYKYRILHFFGPIICYLKGKHKSDYAFRRKDGTGYSPIYVCDLDDVYVISICRRCGKVSKITDLTLPRSGPIIYMS